MREIIYAMRFMGQAEVTNEGGNVLAASTTAPGSSLTCTVGDDGLVSQLTHAAGSPASFTSEVTFTSETDFLETGAITFGDGNTLLFSTVGRGYLAPSADPARKHGTVMWTIDQGTGQFTGATGLITSNFFVDDQLGVVDHHFGVLLVP
jgi:hypothetical protein